MKRFGRMLVSMALVGLMVIPMPVKAAELQKQQGTKVLKGMVQEGKQYDLPADCQAVYSLVINPLDLQPALVSFDGNNQENFAINYVSDNAGIDVYTPLEGDPTKRQCSTIDLSTNAVSSHSSVYLFTETGVATTQHDLDIHDIKNGVVTGTIESEDDGFFYDGAGRLTSGNYNRFTYTYNADGRLAKVSTSGELVGKTLIDTVEFNYFYDADGDLAQVIEINRYANGIEYQVATTFIY